MVDYEAAFEDVMRYMPATDTEIDSQSKLKRFLRQNDTGGNMSNKFLEKITETRAAEELLEGNISQTQLKTRAIENKERVQKEKGEQQAEYGRNIKGTYTDKKGIRHPVFENVKGQTVFQITEGKAAGRFRRADGSGKFATGKEKPVNLEKD